MMTRLQKRLKKQDEVQQPPSFIDQITQLPITELTRKIEGDDAGSKYSKQELVCIVECKKLPLNIRRLAYLSLIPHSELSDLQRLAKTMDFSCQDSKGNDAFRLAAIYDRIDVMHWLHDSINIFKNIPAEERTNIILHAVTNNGVDVLLELAKPVVTGGFGWNLDVRHANGFTPVKMAIKDKNQTLLQWLIAPVAQGGFGLKLEKQDLRRLHHHKEFSLFSGSEQAPRYYRSKPGRQTSFLKLVEDAGEQHRIDTYVPAFELGKGTHGSVRLFRSTSDTSRNLAVKQEVERRRDEKISGFHVSASAEDAVNELHFLQRAYPNEGPYKLQHYVINDGAGYDYRMIMPFVPGQEFAQAVLSTRSAEEAAMLFLAIAKELERIHDLGFVHGDARSRNILIDIVRDHNGEATFNVHFIDFNNAKLFGSPATIYKDQRDDIPPEQRESPEKKLTRVHPSQDVYTIGFFINSAFDYFREELSPNFPSIIQFCESCMKVNPDERPTLNDFICDLERDLLTCQSNKAVPASCPLM